MEEKIKKNAIRSSLIIFAIMFFVHGFEAIFLRMNETVLGENFINKLFGILVVFIVLRCIKWKYSDIGFARKGIAKNLGFGFLLAIVAFLISYSIEVAILKTQGHSVQLGLFTTGFSLTGATSVNTGVGFILICIMFNVINVIMEEGAFRGLIYKLVSANHSMRFALVFQALLFGIWHIVTPLHSLINGDMNLPSFIGLSIGYIILAGLMGIKWGLLYRMTGSLYAGMADHFFNNCIATNLLHVSTESGTDEMMIVRVMIAQLLSFVLVLIIWMKKNKKDRKNAN